MEVPETFQWEEFWIEQARRIVSQEEEHWRLRLQVWRSGSGLYTPVTDAPHWLLEAMVADPPNLQEKGLRLGISAESVVAPGPFTAFKTLQSLPYVMASREAQKRMLDDVVLLNTHGRVAESSNSNIWIYDGKAWYTPPLSEGCVAGVFRSWLQEKASPFPIMEAPVERVQLDSAESILLGNSIRGLRWVKELEGRLLTRPEAHISLQAAWLSSFI
jgi:branched-subunit amino acid aminotransferase/4-amino-4-deoxychorismate lyase